MIRYKPVLIRHGA